MRACRIAAMGCALAMVWTGSALGSVWDDGGDDSLWSNPTNWNGDAVPTYAGNDSANFEGDSGTNEFARIDGTVSAEAGTVNLGRNGSVATLEMSGGTLTAKVFKISNTDGNAADLDSISITGSTVNIDISGLKVGASNTVERATVLEPGNWTGVDGFVSVSTSTNWTGPVSGAAEFWRLESPIGVGRGTFILSNGVVTIDNDTGNSQFIVGDGPGAVGTVIMSGGSINIVTNGGAQNNLLIGSADGSTGTFSMADGTIDIQKDLKIGSGVDASGSLSAGGGTVTVGGDIDLGTEVGAGGTLGVSGAAVVVGASVDVGTASNATGNITVSAGSLTTPNRFDLGNSPFSQGNMTVRGGTVTLSANHLQVGSAVNASGELTVSGGDVDVQANKDVDVAASVGSDGTVTVSSGSLTARDFELAKANPSQAELIVWGGDVTVNRNLQLGKAPNAAATLTISGGNLVVDNRMEVGQAAGSTGTVVMTDGLIVINNSMEIGDNGVGVMTFSGGTITNDPGARVGASASGNGTLNVGGTALYTMTVPDAASASSNGWSGGSFRLPNNGVGEMTMTGGKVVQNGDFGFRIGHGGTSGTLNMDGGILEVGNLQMLTNNTVLCVIGDGVIYDDAFFPRADQTTTPDAARLASYVAAGVLVPADTNEVIKIEFDTSYMNTVGSTNTYKIYAAPP